MGRENPASGDEEGDVDQSGQKVHSVTAIYLCKKLVTTCKFDDLPENRRSKWDIGVSPHLAEAGGRNGQDNNHVCHLYPTVSKW